MPWNAINMPANQVGDAMERIDTPQQDWTEMNADLLAEETDVVIHSMPQLRRRANVSMLPDHNLAAAPTDVETSSRARPSSVGISLEPLAEVSARAAAQAQTTQESIQTPRYNRPRVPTPQGSYHNGLHVHTPILRDPAETNEATTRLQPYLLDLACTPSPPRRTPRARPSPLELAHASPNLMLRYDNRHLVLPYAYLEARRQPHHPTAIALALQLLNPYQVESIRGILTCDLTFAIEDGQAEDVLEDIARRPSRDERSEAAAVWGVGAYAQHVRALEMLGRCYRLGDPYEEAEYRGLMSGWEGTRRREWRVVESRRENWRAMMRELEV